MTPSSLKLFDLWSRVPSNTVPASVHLRRAWGGAQSGVLHSFASPAACGNCWRQACAALCPGR